jgi:SAM-dependent methyltransferase
LKTVRSILRVSRDLAREAYFLLLIPPFLLLRWPAGRLASAWPHAAEQYQRGLIRLLDMLVFPWSAPLREIRAASRDPETYWRRYDGQGLELYARALSDPVWFHGRRILDVGCGLGRKSYELARGGAERVLGIDLSLRSVQAAQKMGKGQANLEFRAVDLSDLAKWEGSFDYAVSFTVFEHLSDVAGVLRGIRRMLRPDGRCLIVFNHYQDKYGLHLKEFISYPWPQLIFPEPTLFRFWNRELERAHQRGEMGLFPRGYRHGLDGHNHDCFMNLNRLSIEEFRALVPGTGLVLEREDAYSISPLLRRFPWIGQTRLEPYLRGSVTYVLRRNS